MAPLEVVINLLKESYTNVIPINTHRLDENKNHDYLEVGYAGVPYHVLSQHIDTTPYIKMLNINLQTSAEKAINKTKTAYSMTGFPIVKLEVLEPEHKYSNQDEIVKATKKLIEWDSTLMVCPLFDNEIITAKRLVDAGAPLLRVMGSGIGSCAGIKDIDTFHEICQLNVPVILDGGIGKIEDARAAMEAGATGILINSMLFQQAQDPASVMNKFSNSYRELLKELYASELVA